MKRILSMVLLLLVASLTMGHNTAPSDVKLLISRLNQSNGSDCAVDTIFNDTAIYYLDEAPRQSVGEYQIRFSDDALTETNFQVNAARHVGTATNITFEYVSEATLAMHSKDGRNQPVDINGEVYFILRLEP